jgi:hypothetical protein
MGMGSVLIGVKRTRPPSFPKCVFSLAACSRLEGISGSVYTAAPDALSPVAAEIN